MDNYIFISHLDQPENEIYSIQNSVSIEDNCLLADNDPNCNAFNISGSFKSEITNLVQGSGIYIKKEAYEKYLNANKWPIATTLLASISEPIVTDKEKVKGIILVVSCQKYLNNRVKDFKMKQLDYDGWKVVTVIGDVNLEKEYTYIHNKELNINLLTIQCEDTYLHLLKKLSLSMKYLLSMYDIQEGILRLGDDIEVFENLMGNFLNIEKNDYMGWCGYKNNTQIKKYINIHISQYYVEHKNELKNMSITQEQINQLILVPTTTFCIGTIVYFSLTSCKCIIQELEKMNWDIFYYDELYGYINIIEDIGISCLLFNNGILPTMHMFHGGMEQYVLGYTDHKNVIGKHTNKYKND